jgi:hypothetical protein
VFHSSNGEVSMAIKKGAKKKGGRKATAKKGGRKKAAKKRR